MKSAILPALLVLLLLAPALTADTRTIVLTVRAGRHNSTNEPICVPLSLPQEFAGQTLASLEINGKQLPGQLTRPSLTTEHVTPSAPGLIRRDLNFILPDLKAGATLTCTCVIHSGTAKETSHFLWKERDRDYSELSWDDGRGQVRPVLRYMHRPYDDSTPDARNRSYKVFHHLFDPAGKRLVTNGGHTDPYTNAKDLLYPHHRGLMFGFNRITYDKGKKADTWHCPPANRKQKTGENYVEHNETLAQEAGPVLGRHRVLIDWHGSKKDVFAREEREVTVYHVPGGTLLDFASRLKATDGPVQLDGDPQHAGFQFRASNDIVTQKTEKQTYFLRVGGKGKPGETINWTAKKPPQGTVNVPWKAMSFVLDDRRYTVAYLDDPHNPGEHRHSERDYGRVGYYFQYQLTKAHPLQVHYRVWLQAGEMTASQVNALEADFVAPSTVTVKDSPER